MNAPLFSLTLVNTLIRVTPLLIIGMAAAIILALNATLMLVAPTHREVLPRWVRAPDSLLPAGLRPKEDDSTAEVRLTGLLVLLMLTWVVYDMLSRPH